MPKTLCEKKNTKTDKKPRFQCKKCKGLNSKKNNLCKPKKIKDPAE